MDLKAYLKGDKPNIEGRGSGGITTTPPRKPDWTLTEGFQRQAELYKPVFDSQDAREGAAAFAEKREPVWRGT